MLDNAKWVSCFGEESPKIRGKIHIKDNVDNVEIEIFGLGMFKLFINGNSVKKTQRDGSIVLPLP